MSDPALRAALFRFVDVRPACATPAGRHPPPARAARGRRASPATPAAPPRITGRKLATRPVAAIAGAGVKQMAQRFIVGADAKDALPTITKLWKRRRRDDRRPARRGHGLRGRGRPLHAALRGRRSARSPPPRPSPARRQPLRQGLRAHAAAARPGARARDRGRPPAPAPPAARRPRRRRPPARGHGVLRHARGDHRAHARPALPSPSSPTGPSAGIVLQAYLTESPEHLERAARLGAASTPREHPFTIRLVKGAYWDHEVVQAAQHGWAPPVFTDRRACDRNFELLTKRLIDATPTVRVAIASPQPALDLPRRRLRRRPQRRQRRTSSSRSCAGWATTRRPRSPPPAAACARYCPVGDLVAGMAYLVRRLLENTANDSFLAAHASGTDTAELLEAP